MIAAAGLAFGSLSVAGASTGHQPPSIDQQAARVKAQDAYTPVNGNTELNVNVLEDQIEHYYGSATATFPVVGQVTIPSATSNYAKQMKQIVANAESYLAWASYRPHGHGKPAVVFDIDDTLLNTYDYTLAEQFGYTSASNAIWVNAAAFPAVFYMPQLVSYAASHGYAVFYITGRAAVPDRGHDQGPDQRGLRGPAGRAPVPQAVHTAVLPALRGRADLHHHRVQVRYS